MMSWHDIHAIWLKGPTTIENQRQAEQSARALFDRWPRGVGMMVVIDVALPALPPDVRKELDVIYLVELTVHFGEVVEDFGHDLAFAEGFEDTANDEFRGGITTEPGIAGDFAFGSHSATIGTGAADVAIELGERRMRGGDFEGPLFMLGQAVLVFFNDGEGMFQGGGEFEAVRYRRHCRGRGRFVMSP